MEKESIKSWLKDRNKVILAIIIILAIILRLYYYSQTIEQPMWWDEAQYMAEAKAIGIGIPYELDPIRPPAFQWIGALFFVLGISDYIFKFLFVLIPSIVLVYLFYSLGKEMFNEKVGLVSAFLAAVSWTLLFWTNRYQPDFISMCFQVLAIIFFVRYWKNNNRKDIIYAGLFSALGFYFKVSALIVPMIFIVWIILKDGYKAVLNKNYYYYAGTFLVALIPYFIWAKAVFNNFLAFAGGYSGSGAASPFTWSPLWFFDDVTDKITVILFLIAVIFALRYLLGIDLMFKNQKLRTNNEFLSILAIIVISSFYIFYIRGGVEDRWVFLWLPFIFMLVGNLLTSIDLGQKYIKYVTCVLVALILFAGYMEISQGNLSIESKDYSYLPVKEAGLWLKDNSNADDIIMSNSVPQNSYYSERRTKTLDPIKSGAEYDEFLKNNHPRYMIFSGYERHDAWIGPWIDDNMNRLIIQKTYADAEMVSETPSLYLFEIKY